MYVLEESGLRSLTKINLNAIFFFQKFQLYGSNDLQNSCNFWQFLSYFFEFWKYYLGQTPLIDSGQLNWPKEAKITKNLISEFHVAAAPKLKSPDKALINFGGCLSHEFANFDKKNCIHLPNALHQCLFWSMIWVWGQSGLL